MIVAVKKIIKWSCRDRSEDRSSQCASGASLCFISLVLRRVYKMDTLLLFLFYLIILILCPNKCPLPSYCKICNDLGRRLDTRVSVRHISILKSFNTTYLYLSFHKCLIYSTVRPDVKFQQNADTIFS